MPLGANKAAIMGVAGVSTGDVVLLSSQTASGDSSITFSSGIDSTYGEYIFRFYNINPADDGLTSVRFMWQVNATDSSSYNETITSTAFRAFTYESGSPASSLAYNTAEDLAQGTGYQHFGGYTGNGADESLAGEFHLFNPSSTTYVKQFSSQEVNYQYNDRVYPSWYAGYINTTTAIDDIQFKFQSGNFDGIIKMWGVK